MKQNIDLRNLVRLQHRELKIEDIKEIPSNIEDNIEENPIKQYLIRVPEEESKEDERDNFPKTIG